MYLVETRLKHIVAKTGVCKSVIAKGNAYNPLISLLYNLVCSIECWRAVHHGWAEMAWPRTFCRDQCISLLINIVVVLKQNTKTVLSQYIYQYMACPFHVLHGIKISFCIGELKRTQPNSVSFVRTTRESRHFQIFRRNLWLTSSNKAPMWLF